MQLNVSQDFQQRWLATPMAVRQVYLDRLAQVCDLLTPEADMQAWLEHDQQDQIKAQARIQQGYLDYQAELIAAARLKQRLILEEKITKQRALKAKQDAELEQAEQQAYQAQNQALQLLRQQQDQSIHTYIARYQKNPKHRYIGFNQSVSVPDTSMLSELESVRLRLELEAEAVIEAKLNELRRVLKAAAQEEIELALQNSAFSHEKSHQEGQD